MPSSCERLTRSTTGKLPKPIARLHYAPKPPSSSQVAVKDAVETKAYEQDDELYKLQAELLQLKPELESWKGQCQFVRNAARELIVLADLKIGGATFCGSRTCTCSQKKTRLEREVRQMQDKVYRYNLFIDPIPRTTTKGSHTQVTSLIQEIPKHLKEMKEAQKGSGDAIKVFSEPPLCKEAR